MKTGRRAKFDYSLFTVVAVLLAGSAVADPIYQPSGPALVYGDVTYGKRLSSATGNPAAAAAAIGLAENGRARSGTLFAVGAGLEYGNVQDLFDVIDKVSERFAPSDPVPGEPPPPGQDPDEKPPGGIEIGDILDLLDPDLVETIGAVADEVTKLGALLAIIKVEGYGKLHASADLPVVIGREFWGGAWTMDLNVTGTSKAFGIVQEIEFDANTALAELEAAFNLQPGDPVTTFDLTGGVSLTVDPSTGKVRLSFDNDSLLLTRSAVVTEFALGYGRPAKTWDSGTLFWGAKAKYFNTRLSRLSTRFGDITDSDELFDSIRNADFRTVPGVGFDFGLLWASRRYQLGATLVNINEPSFNFPEVDTSTFTDQRFIDGLADDTKLTFERQLKLEGSLYSVNRRWSLNAALDVNAVRDPMQDHYQWATISAGYTTESWWIPGARIGYRKNLEGSQLGYIGAGLTLFKVVNLDVATSVDTVSISGNTLPRGLIVNLGVEISF